MTRRPKTPRTAFGRKWFDFHTELHYPAPLGYRRQPKGRRAKSGQWWRRTPCPVLLGPDVCETMRVHGWNHAWGVDYADRSNEP